MKRKNAEADAEAVTPGKTRTTPARSRRSARHDTSDVDHDESRGTVTPSKRKTVSIAVEHSENEIKTPTKRTNPATSHQFETPTKTVRQVDEETPAPLVRNADRSARRKSARQLLQHTAAGNLSDEEAMDEEAELAERILDEDEAANESPEEEDDANEDQLLGEAIPRETPSKRGRGRPKKRRKQRTPTPPRDLPPFEQYFYQNRPGAAKTSNNTLAGLPLLSHEEYFEIMEALEDPHAEQITFLDSLHRRSFDDWIFELEQGFNLCLYGWGSKRELLLSFASYLAEQQPPSKIIVVNGYHAATNLRSVFTTLASAVPSLASSNQKLGAQPADMLNIILTAMAAKPPSVPYTLLVHSIDSPSLRRPATQSLLARLASSPHIRLVASADTPNFPLLWDASLCAQFRWLYHDATTFRSLSVEIGAGGSGGGIVDEVNALIGRTGRKMQGREGVLYVLRSLTESARSLYALLIAELLSLEDVDLDEAMIDQQPDDDDDEEVLATPRKGAKPRGTIARTAGIDFRTLYQKSTSQFIATNESTFRGLLREFYDHEMLVSRKDGMGGEVFGVPFRREEMEAILGELAV